MTNHSQVSNIFRTNQEKIIILMLQLFKSKVKKVFLITNGYDKLVSYYKKHITEVENMI